MSFVFRQLAARTAAVGTSHLTYSRRLMSVFNKQYENILTARPEPGVALVTLNRPKALNALNSALFAELNEALRLIDADKEIGAIVITGSERAFAAGADIKEMKDKSFAEVYTDQFLADWQDLTSIRKPIIAAVSGYALGGGCELALMADILLAAPSAQFGQPEVNIGTITGGGGSQRLARAVGKSRAMELTLTGRMWSAQDAVAWGMASRVVEAGDAADGVLPVVREAVALAREIAAKSQVAVQAQKEAVNVAFEQGLSEGLRTERRLFHMTFATADQKEGMAAFAEKRKPNFTNS
ncbi:enoyl-CoA hydratase [Lactarius akahatsu]|uniref:Probable enoyl-CoA hydratase, mitochondrial n=1 Tax=Lactarius akahatsu TaxID=416441 RepID=A0AAD4L6W2_9AGAM|nr:enoyl-CoA hydratase [Lactarius akahatsu]